MNPTIFLLWLTILRVFLLAIFISEGATFFSDDGVTRLLIADEWSKDPFFSTQTPWLPLQFYLIGSVSFLTGLSTIEIGLALNFIFVLAIPYLYFWALPSSFSIQEKFKSTVVIGLWPWLLLCGVSGLSEPLMWFFALISFGAYQKKKNVLFVVALVLLTMTRIEAWIFSFVFLAFFANQLWREGKKQDAILVCLVVSAWPIAWQLWQIKGELLTYAIDVRQADASRGYPINSIFRFFLFPAIAFFAAPSWIFFLRKIKNPLDEMAKIVILFAALFWLASLIVGLSTAIPQRNFILPLLMISPWLIKNAKSKWVALCCLWQIWTLFHVEHLIKSDLQAERNWLSQSIKQIPMNEKEIVMVSLESGFHSYLPRHLVVRGLDKEKVFVDQQPGRWQTDPPETWLKYSIYEKGTLSKRPILNYWRSYKKNLSLKESLSFEEVRETLMRNNVECIISSSDEIWPSYHGYFDLARGPTQTIWSRVSAINGSLESCDVKRRPSKKEILYKIYKSREMTKQSLSECLKMIGI